MSTEGHVVRLTGWKVGFRTIDLMKLIREAARVDLRKAKVMVEDVLNGGEVTIPFETEEQALTFFSSAELTGVTGRVEPQSMAGH